MIKDYIKLAWENITHRKIRSWLTIIGIVIGIAAVVALISLGQGLQYTVDQQFQKIGVDKLLVQAKSVMYGPPGSLPTINKLTTKDRDVVKRSSGVMMVQERLMRQGRIEFNKKIKYTFIIAFPLDETKLILEESGQYDLAEGRLLKSGDKNKIVVGADFVKESYFGKEVRLNDKITINDEEFTVVGILKASGNPGTGTSIFMNIDTARELFDVPDEVSMLAVKIDFGENPDVVAATITKDLRRSRGVEENKEDFTVESPRKTFESFLVILNIVNVLLVGLASISILVGAVGIANTMYTSVLERTNEIGVMKAIGARNSDILQIFLIEAGMVGLVGGAIGLLVGMGIGKLAEFILLQILGSGIFVVVFPWYLIVGSLVFAVGIGMLSGIMPARQAASMTPVDALRQ